MQEREWLSQAAAEGDAAKVTVLAPVVGSLDYLDSSSVPDNEFQQAGETLPFEEWRILKGGLSPLMRAARGGHLACVQELIRNGASLDLGDHPAIPPWKRTALMYAAQAGHGEVVAVLLRAGAKPDLKDEHVMGEGGGMTALHYAVESKQEGIVTQLAAAGAPLNVRDKTGLTPVAMAVSSQSFRMLECLLKLGASPNSGLEAACQQADAVYLKVLLSSGAKPGKSSHKLLLVPCEQGRLEMVKLLIQSGVGLQPDKPDPNGFDTPIMCATEKNHVEIVEVLLDAGALLHPRLDKIAKRANAHKVTQLLKKRALQIARQAQSHQAP